MLVYHVYWDYMLVMLCFIASCNSPKEMTKTLSKTHPFIHSSGSWKGHMARPWILGLPKTKNKFIVLFPLAVV